MENNRNWGGGYTPIDPKSGFDWEARIIAELIACGGAFIQFNITKDQVLGTPFEVSDGIFHALYGSAVNPVPHSYSDVIDKCKNSIADEERGRFLEKLNGLNLKLSYSKGQQRFGDIYHMVDLHKNKTPVYIEMVMYEEKCGDGLLGFLYARRLKADGDADRAEGAYDASLKESVTARPATIIDCYGKLGGDYADVRTRLSSLGLIEKFLARFIKDDTFERLCRCIESGDCKGAFLAARTLESICANLSFTMLQNSASALADALGTQSDVISDFAINRMEAVRRDYRTTIDAINEYLG